MLLRKSCWCNNWCNFMIFILIHLIENRSEDFCTPFNILNLLLYGLVKIVACTSWKLNWYFHAVFRIIAPVSKLRGNADNIPHGSFIDINISLALLIISYFAIDITNNYLVVLKSQIWEQPGSTWQFSYNILCAPLPPLPYAGSGRISGAGALAEHKRICQWSCPDSRA